MYALLAALIMVGVPMVAFTIYMVADRVMTHRENMRHGVREDWLDDDGIFKGRETGRKREDSE